MQIKNRIRWILINSLAINTQRLYTVDLAPSSMHSLSRRGMNPAAIGRKDAKAPWFLATFMMLAYTWPDGSPPGWRGQEYKNMRHYSLLKI
jgi:hypothetical protein